MNTASEPELRVLVTGGRDYDDKAEVNRVLGALGLEHECEYRMPRDIRVAHGGARGADTLADDWCVVNWVPVHVYEADWKQYGKKAGVLRNMEMLEDFKPDLVVAFPGGKGTAHCMEEARRREIPVYAVYKVNGVGPKEEDLLDLREFALKSRQA